MIRCEKLSECGRRWDAINASRKSVFASGARGLFLSSCTLHNPDIWEMRAHIVSPSIWVGSLRHNYVGMFVFSPHRSQPREVLFAPMGFPWLLFG